MKAETRIKDMEKILEYSIEKGLKKPIMIYGKVGVGKSETVRNVSKSLGIGFIDLRVLLFSEVELKGIPFPNEDRTSTVWLKNNLLPEAERDGERGILLLDELPAAKPAVMTALYQLCLDRALGEYKLPEGWTIVATGNREEDRGIYYEMPPALSDRFIKFNMMTSAEDWLSLYAYKNGVNHLVTSFISFAPDRIHTYNQELEMTSSYFATPRTWVGVSDILNTASEEDPIADKIVWELIRGSLDDVTYSMFFEFCRLKDELPDIDGILEGEEVQLPKQEDKKHLVIGTLANKVSEKMKEDFEKTGKLLLEKDTVKRVENALRFAKEELEPSLMAKFLKEVSLKDRRIAAYFQTEDFELYDEMIDEISEILE